MPPLSRTGIFITVLRNAARPVTHLARYLVRADEGGLDRQISEIIRQSKLGVYEESTVARDLQAQTSFSTSDSRFFACRPHHQTTDWFDILTRDQVVNFKDLEGFSFKFSPILWPDRQIPLGTHSDSRATSSIS